MTQLAATMNMEESQQHQSQTSVESAADEERRPLEAHKSKDIERSEGLGHVDSSQATASLPSSALLENGDQPRNGESAANSQHVIDLTLGSNDIPPPAVQSSHSSPTKRTYEDFAEFPTEDDRDGASTTEDDASHLVDSQESLLSARRLETRRNAFNAMMGIAPAHFAWNGLLSTTNNHIHPESELGEGSTRRPP